MDIVLASGNQKKIKELQQTLSSLQCNVIPQSEFNVTEADETGLSFIENAILKARHASKAAALPAIADDSGLSVLALNGAPGIYSARYSAMDGEGNASDERNNQKLLAAMDGIDDRRAFFYCALAFVSHADDPTPLVVTGAWHGNILDAAQGEHGFGYDPLFYVEAHNCSSAQLEPSVKNAISHRGIAMQQLLPALISHLGLTPS
ncbi:MAG: RdgB/HAM1 family non-canonical purine NTP pyrophosphatase [Pseudomonadota bacterium]